MAWQTEIKHCHQLVQSFAKHCAILLPALTQLTASAAGDSNAEPSVEWRHQRGTLQHIWFCGPNLLYSLSSVAGDLYIYQKVDFNWSWKQERSWTLELPWRQAFSNTDGAPSSADEIVCNTWCNPQQRIAQHPFQTFPKTFGPVEFWLLGNIFQRMKKEEIEWSCLFHIYHQLWFSWNSPWTNAVRI